MRKFKYRNWHIARALKKCLLLSGCKVLRCVAKKQVDFCGSVVGFVLGGNRAIHSEGLKGRGRAN